MQYKVGFSISQVEFTSECIMKLFVHEELWKRKNLIFNRIKSNLQS